jgi:hypothetical protein
MPNPQLEADMPKQPRRAYDLVDHQPDQEEHPVDVLVRRDPRVRALNERVRQAMRQFEKVVGPRQRKKWLGLEELLAERAASREELYFDQGHAHGFAAGRAERMTSTPEARALAAQLRDHAIQSGCAREGAVAALLEAAWALVTKGEPTRTRRSAR